MSDELVTLRVRVTSFTGKAIGIQAPSGPSTPKKESIALSIIRDERIPTIDDVGSVLNVKIPHYIYTNSIKRYERFLVDTPKPIRAISCVACDWTAELQPSGDVVRRCTNCHAEQVKKGGAAMWEPRASSPTTSSDELWIDVAEAARVLRRDPKSIYADCHAGVAGTRIISPKKFRVQLEIYKRALAERAKARRAV